MFGWLKPDTSVALVLLQSAVPEWWACHWLKWMEDSCCSRCISTLLITSSTFYSDGITFNPVTHPSVKQNAPLQPQSLRGTDWLSHLFVNLRFFYLFFFQKLFSGCYFLRKLISPPSNHVPFNLFFTFWHQRLTLLLLSFSITTLSLYFTSIPHIHPHMQPLWNPPLCLIFLVKVQDLSQHIQNIYPSVVQDERRMKYAKR